MTSFQFSGLIKPLPKNIHLLTLKQLDSYNVLIRLEHIFQKNEHPDLSRTVTIDLNGIISNFNITQIQELSLAGNQVLNSNGKL